MKSMFVASGVLAATVCLAAAPDEPYPDCLSLPVLNLPGGYKASKWSGK